MSGDATTSGSNAVTVVKINGNSVPSGATAHQMLVATAANTFSLKTITDCNGGSNALNYTQSTDAWSCLSIATLSNPMNTLGDMINGGSAGAVARLAGPTSGNSPYVLISLPSGGAATAPAWAVAGVPVDTESGASFTVQSDAQTTPDRAKIVNLTNNTTSTGLTVPQAGSSGMLSSYPFGVINSGGVVATATPTTSTVNGNATLKLVGAVTGHNPEMSFWWSDAVSSTGNWWAAEILPTDANGRLGCEGLMALTGDVTNTAGTCSTVVAKINGTTFTGTANDVVAFGASGIVPLDTSVLYTNLVTAASNYTSGNLVQAAGNNKTTSDSSIATANVVTAASNYISGGLLYAAAANKTTTNSADFAVSTHTLSGGASGILDLHSMSATAGFLPPSAAGAVPTTSGVVAFDSTAKDLVWGNTTNTSQAAFFTGAPAGSKCLHTSGTTGLITETAGDCGTNLGNNAIIPQGVSLTANLGGGFVLVGSSLTAGNLYGWSSGGALAAAEASSSSTQMPAICVAISTTQCAFSGVYKYTGSQAWTVGGVIYASDGTAGTLTQTAPSTSGHFVQRVGIALANDTILIMPSMDVGTVQ